MLLHPPLNKNRKQFSRHTDDFHKPSAHNPLFQKKLKFVGCPYSRAKGRKKNYSTLWRIWLHVKFEHPKEIENFQPIIWNLSDFLLRGILT